MNIKQHDQLTLKFRAHIDLSNATNIRFLANTDTRPTTPYIDKTAAVDSGNSKVVVVELTSAETAEDGTYNVEIETTWPDGSIITLPNKGYLQLVIEPDLGGVKE